MNIKNRNAVNNSGSIFCNELVKKSLFEKELIDHLKVRKIALSLEDLYTQESPKIHYFIKGNRFKALCNTVKTTNKIIPSVGLSPCLTCVIRFESLIARLKGDKL